MSMSTDVYVYLGPTIVVPTRFINESQDFYACSSVSCKNHEKSTKITEKFCSSCGSANQSRKIDKKVELEPYDEDPSKDYDHWYGMFMNKSVDDRIFYVPNFYLSKKDIFSLYDDEKYSQFELDLSSVDLKANLEKFKNLAETKELIELLKRFYSDEEIVISYRLFKYCH